jgi:hypothetical protein
MPVASLGNFPSTIDERIFCLRNHSELFDASGIKDNLLEKVMIACKRAQIEVRVDTGLDPASAKKVGRLGLSVYSEGSDPIIFLVKSMNPTIIELTDTVIHEALHATGKRLGRHVQPPEDEGSTEYSLEELCVYYGITIFYNFINDPAYLPVLSRNRENYKNIGKSLGSVVSNEVIELWMSHGEKAAQYLIQSAISKEQSSMRRFIDFLVSVGYGHDRKRRQRLSEIFVELRVWGAIEADEFYQVNGKRPKSTLVREALELISGNDGFEGYGYYCEVLERCGFHPEAEGEEDAVVDAYERARRLLIIGPLTRLQLDAMLDRAGF